MKFPVREEMDLVHVHTTRAESDKKKNLPLDLASETRTKIEQIQMHQSSSTRIQSTHVLCFERQREGKNILLNCCLVTGLAVYLSCMAFVGLVLSHVLVSRTIRMVVYLFNY